MKNLSTKLTTSLLALPIMAASTYAADITFDKSCNISLNHDLTITPQHVLIIENDETVIDIYNDNMLFIKGEPIKLTEEQTELVSQYSLSLRKAIPEVAEIAVDAVDVAFKSINTALGNDNDAHQYGTEFDQLKQKLRAKYQSEDATYRFNQGNFSTTLEDEELENIIENMVQDMIPSLIGNIITNIGQSIAAGDSELTELDNLGDRIEAEIENNVDGLEDKADKFCQRVHSIDQIEEKLVKSETNFSHFNLIDLKLTRG